MATTPSHDGLDAHWMGMDGDLLRRVRKTAASLGLVMAIPLSFYFGVAQGGAWLLGIAWSLVNLHFLSALIRNVITVEDRQLSKVLLAVIVKFPVLYVAGFLLLKIPNISVLWLVAGFTWPFFVIVMKGLGRHYMGLDERSESSS